MTPSLRAALASTLAAALFAGAALAQPSQNWTHPFAIAQPETAPETVMAVIEIPQGGITKYEIDPVTGHVLVDRYMAMPVAYPANYGALPSTLAGDGDPLDVLVLTHEPIIPGAVIEARPIGVLMMIDGGEADEKIIAVPADHIDPGYAHIRDMDDLPAGERDRIEAFFEIYKNLDAGASVQLDGFRDAETARALISETMAAYTERP